MELFKDHKLVNKDSEERFSENILKNRIVALFFSAKWSPPCREFIGKLSDVYEELRFNRKAPFEVVFISLDKSEEEMFHYMSELHSGWWAVNFKDELRSEIISKFNIKLVPKLIVVNPSGEIVTDKGRKEVEDRGVAAFRTWLAGAGIASARIKTPDFTKETLFEETRGTDEVVKDNKIESVAQQTLKS